MDLHQLIDDTIEQPSPLRLDAHLAAGRRAVRRRRVAAAGGAAAAVVVVAALAVTTPWSAGGPQRSVDPAPAASAPVTGSSVPPGDAPGPGLTGLTGEQDLGPLVAQYALGGELVVKDGWEQVERIDGPVTDPVEVDATGDTAVPDESVALELTDGTRSVWVLAWRSGDDASAIQDDADVGPESLRDWVVIRLALATGGATDAVAEVDDDVITGRNGVQVLDQRRTPELDTAGTTTAVAKVRFPASDPVPGWILSVRSADGVRTYPVAGYPVVGTADDGPDTVSGFAAWVAPEVAEGRYP